jgi:hypothetical protein
VAKDFQANRIDTDRGVVLGLLHTYELLALSRQQRGARCSDLLLATMWRVREWRDGRAA